MKQFFALFMVAGLVFAVGCGKDKNSKKDTPKGDDTPSKKGTDPVPSKKAEIPVVKDKTVKAMGEAAKGKVDTDIEVTIVIVRSEFDDDVKVGLEAGTGLTGAPKELTIAKGKTEAKIKVKAAKEGSYEITATPMSDLVKTATPGKIKVEVTK